MRITVSMVLLLLAAVALFVLQRGDGQQINASIALADAMSGDTLGYARAIEVRDLEFPVDFGPHPDYKTEWWYYTGNVESESGRRFGYELTIFRFAVAPPKADPDVRSSDWATNQMYMAHFSMTDVASGKFYAFERFSRGAAGLAGAQSAPYRIWLEDWSIESGEGGVFPMRLRAAEEDVAIDLHLVAAKPMVLQGDNGLDPKGPGLGNASYYYSFTRLETSGSITAGGQKHDVSGLSWKDHEWSTSALGADQVGWDWFALQLSDGRDLMYYQLRRRDGSASPYTNGVLVEPDGTARQLSLDDVSLAVLDTWTSSRSGGEYPSGWSLEIPRFDLELTVTPVLDDQELNLSVRYWEGAVVVVGRAAGAPVNGRGYVEMTGYADIQESSAYKGTRSQ